MCAQLAQAQEALEEALRRVAHLEQQRVKDVEEMKASFEREESAWKQCLEQQRFNAVLTQELAELRGMKLPPDQLRGMKRPPDQLSHSSLLRGKGKCFELQGQHEWALSALSDQRAPVTVWSEKTDALPASSLPVLPHAPPSRHASMVASINLIIHSSACYNGMLTVSSYNVLWRVMSSNVA